METNPIKSKVLVSIDGDPLFGHESSPNGPFLAFFERGSFFSDFFLHRRGFVTTRTTYRFQAIIRFHSLSQLFLSTFNCYPIMSPDQTLPSFNLAVHADHYKTVLPNISYPSRPITHIRWSGSSAPLLFSVSQTQFFFEFVSCRNLYFFFALRKPRARR